MIRTKIVNGVEVTILNEEWSDIFEEYTMKLFKTGGDIFDSDDESLTRKEILQKAVEEKKKEEKHDKTVDESFPASDPPSTNICD